MFSFLKACHKHRINFMHGILCLSDKNDNYTSYMQIAKLCYFVDIFSRLIHVLLLLPIGFSIFLLLSTSTKDSELRDQKAVPQNYTQYVKRSHSDP